MHRHPAYPIFFRDFPHGVLGKGLPAADGAADAGIVQARVDVLRHRALLQEHPSIGTEHEGGSDTVQEIAAPDFATGQNRDHAVVLVHPIDSLVAGSLERRASAKQGEPRPFEPLAEEIADREADPSVDCRQYHPAHHGRPIPIIGGSRSPPDYSRFHLISTVSVSKSSSSMRNRKPQSTTMPGRRAGIRGRRNVCCSRSFSSTRRGSTGRSLLVNGPSRQGPKKTDPFGNW